MHWLAQRTRELTTVAAAYESPTVMITKVTIREWPHCFHTVISGCQWFTIKINI